MKDNSQDIIKDSLRSFITENFLPFSGLETFKDADSLLEKGIIDSTGVLELLEYIEENFSLRVEDSEVIPENLDSINNLLNYIARKKSDARH
jgi:acyl carrier protein